MLHFQQDKLDLHNPSKYMLTEKSIYLAICHIKLIMMNSFTIGDSVIQLVSKIASLADNRRCIVEFCLNSTKVELHHW